MIRAIFFLQRQPKSGVLYFRRAIPQRYRHAFNGKCEIKRSLRTCDKKVAAPLAMVLYAELQNKFNELDGICAMGDDNFWGKVTSSVIDFKGRKRERTFDTGDDEKDMTLADAFEEKYASATHAPVQNIRAAVPAVSTVESMKLATAIEQFIADRSEQKGWAVDTAGGYESSLAWLLQYFGNVEISTITRAQARAFREKVKMLPPNPGKGKFKGKTFRQILRMDYEKVIAPETFNNSYVVRFGALFNWAVEEGYCPTNPFRGLKVSTDDAAIEKKNPFTLDELNAIFNSPKLYQCGQDEWKYWTALIALYSGARQQEISQLRVEDLVDEDGVYGFHIRTYDDPHPKNGRVKNKSSTRKVPFHPVIIEKGFLQYALRMGNSGETKLFPQLFGTQQKTGDKVSKWFNRTFLESLNIDKQERKVSFHSLRHNVGDCLHRARTPDREAYQVLGHAFKDVHQEYGSRCTLRELRKVLVEAVNYEGLIIPAINSDG